VADRHDGDRIRREVLGDAYVDANRAAADDFMMTFQDLVTDLAWGRAWGGAALSRREKSLLSLGILAGLGRFEELAIYTGAALRAGLGVDEIREAMIHVAIYCGTPAGRQAFRAAHDGLVANGALPANG
jgi:4-carboxymuconolactone decarboxylase